MSSRIPGFYRLTPTERLAALGDAGLADAGALAALNGKGLTLAQADMMVENVVGRFVLPNAMAMNFLINGKERVVPMVVEEPSVVAAVSNMARLTRPAGGFTADSDPSEMIGQVHLPVPGDSAAVAQTLREALPRLRRVAEAVHPRIVERGGGIRDMSVRELAYDEPGHPVERMVVLHFVLDCVDAMGANMVNTIAERLAPHVEAITGLDVGLRILSNLADRRLARARVSLAPEHLAADRNRGADVARGIASAWRFAWADPYRAATHNKGVMNGIDAVALATGNDWRAIEAGAHAFCCRDGQYRPMTRWEVDESGILQGSIEVPLQVGTVGGPIRVHPTVQANLAVLGITTARELAEVAAAVGLAQNLGALRALVTEGIQQGHMRMHARTVAATAGASPHEVGSVTEALVTDQDFSVERALAVLRRLRGSD